MFLPDRLLKIYKIEPSGFSSTKLLAELIRDTEELYAANFGERRAPDLDTTTDVGTEKQFVATRRERLITFALDGNRRPAISPLSDLVYI